MSRGPAYDAKENGGGASPEEQRGRARHRAASPLAQAQARQQQQHAGAGDGGSGSSVLDRVPALGSRARAHARSPVSSAGRISLAPGSGPSHPANRSRSRSVAPSLPIPIAGAATGRRAAFRRAEMAAMGDGSPDPAGRLRPLPEGTRLPPPPPLTDEELERARTLGAQAVPPYPLRSPSPASRRRSGPRTHAEYMREVEERAAEYNAWF
ncbi:hypothetical protein EsH8_VI_000389 [Colletotrichum jinshuiense]